MASYLIIYACNKLYRTARASMAVRAERLASVDQDVESDADDENPGPSTSKKQKMSAKSVGAAKYRTKFQKEWLKVYPFVQEVKDNLLNCCHLHLQENWNCFRKSSQTINYSCTMQYHQMCGIRQSLMKMNTPHTIEWTLFGIICPV